MKRFSIVPLLVALVLLFGCGNDTVPGEDYDDYTDVYSGLGPDNIADLVFKLAFEPGGGITGEMEGPFYARVTGAWLATGQGILVHLESVFGSLECMGITEVEFTGDVVDDQINGVLVYSGCNTYEFFYEGVRVGGTGSGATAL